MQYSFIHSSIYWTLFIVTFITHSDSGLDRPAATSSHSLYRFLPSRLHPHDPQFNITSAIILLFILVTCLGHVYCTFSVSGQLLPLATLLKFIIYSCVQNVRIVQLFLNIAHPLMWIIFLYFCLTVQISVPHKRMGTASISYCVFLFLNISRYNSVKNCCV